MPPVLRGHLTLQTNKKRTIFMVLFFRAGDKIEQPQTAGFFVDACLADLSQSVSDNI
jgi:hypothetical protein